VPQERFSQYLRRKRRELGLSQEDLADDAGISANYLAKLETEKREPGLKVLAKLADALNVSTDELFSVLIQTWPPSPINEPSNEFSHFKPNTQNLIIEIGKLIEKYT
jgi:transcriptional regulator with XRE-family HTH domain